jgi:hypothetical protein
MPHFFDLQNYQTVSNAGILPRGGVQANVGMVIRLSIDGLFAFELFGDPVSSSERVETGKSDLSATDLVAVVDECRQKWTSAVVKFKRNISGGGQHGFEFPFQDYWDLEHDESILNSVLPALARTGEDLFSSVFETSCDAGLKEIGRILKEYLSTQDRCIAITSDDFFLPWGMLYTHPVKGEKLDTKGSNWDKNGFWGYRHVVYQATTKYKLEDGIQPDSTGLVRSSVNFDERLSVALKLPEIDGHIKFVQSLGAKISRTRKHQLAIDFSENRADLERIIYFYCHGRGSDGGTSTQPPTLQLTDDIDTISAYDFKRWAKGELLPTAPLVFVNACQGGQMTTMFYKSFAVELLRQGALGLIGAQIDVPARFAIEYANEVFRTFFAGDSDGPRLGLVVRDINRKFWDQHHNPLGMVYSLYRGANCYIDRSRIPVDSHQSAVVGSVAAPPSV